MKCFSYTYKTLAKEGYDFPNNWEGYSTSNLKKIQADFKKILDEKIHYAYFESFCTYVDTAQKNDIVINDNGIGVAINALKYMTIGEKRCGPMLAKITKDDKILRINNG